MPLTKVKSGGVSDSITLTSPDINAPDIDGGTIDNAVIGGSTAAAGSFTTITATGGSSSNWNTAYGWGDHSTQSYATQTYVGTAVSNLVDSSPAALDTLNELAAALGDDPNFATTVTNSIALKAPLASPSFTGNVGIGCSPNVSLEVDGGTANGSIARFHNENARYLELSAESDGTYDDAISVFKKNTSVGQFAFRNSTTEYMRIDSSGNVGIGTTSPDAPLHIIGNDGVQFNRSGQTNGFIIRPNASADGIRFTQGGTGDRMTIDSSGNVGIGVTAPTRSLVLGKGDSTGVQTQYTNSTTGAALGDGFTVGIDGSENAEFWNFENTNMLFATNSTERMRIDSSGNVGIGTSSPSASKFSSTPDGVLNVSGDKPVVYLTEEDETDSNVWMGLSNEVGIIGNTGTALAFRTGASTATERMRIDSSGRVGIGRVPSISNSKLEVGGADNVSLINVEASGVTGGMGIGSTGLQFFHGSTARMRIDSSGKVGIGTPNPSENLHVEGSMMLDAYNVGAEEGLFFREGFSSLHKYNLGIMTYAHGGSSNDGMTIGAYNGFSVCTGSNTRNERLRIDSSGNLMMGKTALNIGIVGQELRAYGSNYFTSSSDTALGLNRLSSDGTVLEIRKDSTVVGSIGANGGVVYVTGPVAGGLKYSYYDSTHASIFPCTTTGGIADDVHDLGYAGSRFNDIYATNGTIQTSDFNEKQDIAELSDAEQRVAVAAKGLLRKFRWKDSVAEKGDEARTHFGIIAQDLQAAFAAEGLDAGDYAMFISSTWTDEETNEEKTRMGVRYSELLAFIIAAI